MKRKAAAADLPVIASASTAAVVDPSKRGRTGDAEFSLNAVPDLPPREEGHVCARKWNKGIEHEADPEWPMLMKPSANCKYEIEGQIAYITFPNNPKWAKTYLSSIERLTPSQLLSQTGVFTWLLYRKGDATLRFVGARVTSPYEIGSIHYALYEMVEATSAHGAGELKRTSDGKVYVNMASGSFVAEWVRPKDAPCTRHDMEDYIFEQLQPFFPGIELNRTSSQETYINTKNLHMTLKDLQLYADAGFTVCLHAKDQVDTCKKLRGECDNPMKASRK